MAAKRGKGKGKKSHKGKKKDHLKSAIESGIKRGLGGGGKGSKKRKDMRPLSFLKEMKSRMEKNLPKLEKLIAKGTSGGRPA